MKRILLRLGDNDFSNVLMGFADLILAAHRHDPEKIEAMTIEDIRILFKDTCRTLYVLYQQRSETENEYGQNATDIERYLQSCVDPSISVKDAEVTPQNTLYMVSEYYSIRGLRDRTPVQKHKMKESLEILRTEKHREFLTIDERIYFDEDAENITSLQPRLLDSDGVYIDFFLSDVKENQEEKNKPIQCYFIM